MTALGQKADICSAQRLVRFTPESGHVQCTSVCPLWANSGHWQLLFDHLSARPSSLGGISIPSDLATLAWWPKSPSRRGGAGDLPMRLACRGTE